LIRTSTSSIPYLGDDPPSLGQNGPGDLLATATDSFFSSLPHLSGNLLQDLARADLPRGACTKAPISGS
jgi:hypothetical protein